MDLHHLLLSGLPAHTASPPKPDITRTTGVSAPREWQQAYPAACPRLCSIGCAGSSNQFFQAGLVLILHYQDLCILHNLSALSQKIPCYQDSLLSKLPLLPLLWLPSWDLQVIHGTTLRALTAPAHRMRCDRPTRRRPPCSPRLHSQLPS